MDCPLHENNTRTNNAECDMCVEAEETMPKDHVEVIEIWETTGEGEFVQAKRPVAILVNGKLVQLFDGFYAESKQEPELKIKKIFNL